MLGPAEGFSEDVWIDWPEETPISEASDAELIEAVRATEGRVFVGFKEPGSTRAAASLQVREGVRQARFRAVTAGSIEAGRNVVRDLGGRITRPYRHLPMVAAVVDPEVVPDLRGHPLVNWVSPSVDDVPPLGGGGSMMAQQTPYHVTRVNAPGAWSATRGLGARVWILDFGVSGGFQHHADLSQLSTYQCLNYFPTATIQNCTDESVPLYADHGTAVAGVALARDNAIDVVGVAPQVGTWGSIKVCVNACSFSAAVDALAFLRVNGQKDVINMSCGNHTGSPELAMAVQDSWNAGDLMVAGAGNLGAQTPFFPSAYPQVIAVSGTNQADGLHVNSNYGSHIELAAPYEVVTLNGTSGTAQWNGTSFSTAAVSGGAALVWSLFPGWTNQQVRNRLKATAEDLGSYGVDSQFGWGMLDTKAAVGLDVSIVGPTVVRPGDFCTWQRVVGNSAGGTMTQQWGGALSGTSSFVSGSVWSSGTLSVDIQTSGGQSGSADLFITVSSGAPLCTL